MRSGPGFCPGALLSSMSPRAGALAGCLDSGVGCSWVAGSPAGCWGLVFFIGMGCGRTCFGKPLKNHAPERFQTSLCSRQILQSHTGCGRLLEVSTPHLVQTFFLQSSHTTHAEPSMPSCSPHRMQRFTPSPATFFLMVSRRSTRRPMRSCSMASIFSARAITRLIISFSSSVSSSCFLCLSVCAPGWTDHPACSCSLSFDCSGPSPGYIQRFTTVSVMVEGWHTKTTEDCSRRREPNSCQLPAGGRC